MLLSPTVHPPNQTLSISINIIAYQQQHNAAHRQCANNGNSAAASGA